MENMLVKLKEYFENTPREEVEKTWAETKKFNNVGPTVDEFIKHNQQKECLHEKCKDCNGTGKKHNGQICIHMISCPCKKCT